MADETRDIRVAKFWEGALARVRDGETIWFSNVTDGAPFAALVPASRAMALGAARYTGETWKQGALAQDPRMPAAPDIVTRLAALFHALAAITDTGYLTSAGVPDWSGDVPLEAHIERWLRHG